MNCFRAVCTVAQVRQPSWARQRWSSACGGPRSGWSGPPERRRGATPEVCRGVFFFCCSSFFVVFVVFCFFVFFVWFFCFFVFVLCFFCVLFCFFFVFICFTVLFYVWVLVLFGVFLCFLVFLVFLILFLDSSRFSPSVALIFVENYCFWTIFGPFYFLKWIVFEMNCFRAVCIYFILGVWRFFMFSCVFLSFHSFVILFVINSIFIIQFQFVINFLLIYFFLICSFMRKSVFFKEELFFYSV